MFVIIPNKLAVNAGNVSELALDGGVEFRTTYRRRSDVSGGGACPASSEEQDMSTGKMSDRVTGTARGQGGDGPSPPAPAEPVKPRPHSLLSPSKMGDVNRGRLLQSLFDLEI